MKLYQLVKKLDPSEKAWVIKCFKVFKQENNLLLFKFLDQQASPFSEESYKKLKNTKFYKYLSVQKHNLYNSILKFLHLYTREDQSNYELLNSILDLTFLQEKGLDEDCLDKLPKLKELADEQQQHIHLLKLISIERDILSNKQFKKEDLIELKEINEAYLNCLGLLNIIWQYRHISSLIKILSSNASILSPSDYQQMQDDVELFFKQQKEPNNTSARYHYYQVNLMYHIYITKNFSKAFFYIEQQLKHLEIIDIKTQSAQKNKLIILVNSIKVGFLAQIEPLEMEVYIKNAHNTIKQDYYSHMQAFLYPELYYNQLNYYNYIGHKEKAELLTKEILKAVQNSRFNLTPPLQLTIAVQYFEQEQYTKAIEWNNQVLNRSPKSLQNQILYSSILLELVIHIELKNTMYLSSILHKFKYAITSKNDTRNELAESVYLFFKSIESKLLSVNTNTSYLYKSFYNEIVTQELVIKQTFQSFNLIQWIKLKMNIKKNI